jgi:hypothetical protein
MGSAMAGQRAMQSDVAGELAAGSATGEYAPLKG